MTGTPSHDRLGAWRPPRGSTAPGSRPAGVALQAGPVADHGEVAAFGAGFADVAFHARFGALLGDGFSAVRGGRGAEGYRRRFGEFALERSCALDVGAGRR